MDQDWTERQNKRICENETHEIPGWSKTCAPSRQKLRNVLELIKQKYLKIQLIEILFTEVDVLECIFRFTIAILLKSVGDKNDDKEQFERLLRSHSG